MRAPLIKKTNSKLSPSSQWYPFNNIVTGICILLIVSLTLNALLLSRQSFSFEENIPSMDYSGNPNTKANKCNKQKTESQPDICKFNASLKGRIYIYDLPSYMRENPRRDWYARHTSLENYNDSKSLNFGFGIKMYDGDWSKKDLHLTHMHVLEIIFNERLKVDDYYLTNDPDKAYIFHIPYPFALHYRFWERTESERITRHHVQLQEWLDANEIHQKYFLDADNRRPHMLTFGRIAYETVRLEKMGSQFLSVDRDMTKYWILSIDRNCHGDPPSCWKRISMPHPSVYHPKDVKSLKTHITKVKKRINENEKSIFISFCGYVRTKHRNISRDTCSKFRRKSKWRNAYSDRYAEICRFEDGAEIKRTVGKNKVKVQYAFGKQCYELYEKSVFCIQDGADSTTRKGLWDGIIAGCIPVFLSGVMSDEFDCYGNDLNPWYVVQQREFYINQLLSLPPEYIKLLQMNLLRLIPKILYTNGKAGFSDAFDLIWHCLMRKTAFENAKLNPQCDINYLVEHHDTMYDFDEILGYDKLYEYLEI